MDVIKGSLREHLGVTEGCACILWEREQAARQIIDFVNSLKGQDVVGVFGKCDNPRNDMIGYQFTRGVVQGVTPSQQLLLQKNHGSLSLRSLCDMIPVQNLGEAKDRDGFSYHFEADPVGKGEIIQVKIRTANPALAYSSVTTPSKPGVHIFTNIRPEERVIFYDLIH